MVAFSTKTSDDCVHRRTDFVAHGRQEYAFGTVGRIGLFLGQAQVLDQLAALADVQPATDDAFHFAQRVTVGQDPVVDGLLGVLEHQRAIDDQRLAFVHYPQVVGLDPAGVVVDAERGLVDRLAEDRLHFHPEGLQVAVVAGLQQAVAVAYIDGVGGAVDHCAHEFELVVECPFDRLALLDLAAHPGIPGQGQEQ